MQIIDWIMSYGAVALIGYLIYVLIAGVAFGVYLWHKLGHSDGKFTSPEIRHRRAD